MFAVVIAVMGSSTRRRTSKRESLKPRWYIDNKYNSGSIQLLALSPMDLAVDPSLEVQRTMEISKNLPYCTRSATARNIWASQQDCGMDLCKYPGWKFL